MLLCHTLLSTSFASRFTPISIELSADSTSSNGSSSLATLLDWILTKTEAQQTSVVSTNGAVCLQMGRMDSWQEEKRVATFTAKTKIATK